MRGDCRKVKRILDWSGCGTDKANEESCLRCRREQGALTDSDFADGLLNTYCRGACALSWTRTSAGPQARAVRAVRAHSIRHLFYSTNDSRRLVISRRKKILAQACSSVSKIPKVTRCRQTRHDAKLSKKICIPRLL